MKLSLATLEELDENLIEIIVKMAPETPAYSRKSKDSRVVSEVCYDRKTNLKLLPQNTIWTSIEHEMFIVQREPEYQLVVIRDDMSPECICNAEYDDDDLVELCDYCNNNYDTVEDHHGFEEGWSRYRLPMPWLLYWFIYSGNRIKLHRILTSSHPLDSLTTGLGSVPLPNMYQNGGMCLGRDDLTEYFKDYNISAQDATNNVINAFWGSGFNQDVEEYILFPVWEELSDHAGSEDAREDAKKVFAAWEALSFEELLKLSWNNGKSITSLLNRRKNIDMGGDYRRMLYSLYNACLRSHI